MQGTEKPSRVRFQVLWLLCSLAFIFYLDRLCLGQASTLIRDELGIDDDRSMSLVHIAFTLAYGIFEIPTGRLGDRFGSRRVLLRIVLWFSAFTMLTSLCYWFWLLVLVRFLFGAGEAGAYPIAGRIMIRWFPATERGRVRGMFMAASSFGGACAPFLSALAIQWVGWRWMFVCFGVLGILWAAVFAWLFCENPDDHPHINQAEKELLAGDNLQAQGHDSPIPWHEVLRHPAIWLLSIVITLSAFYSYLYFSWYPTYLKNNFDMGELASGFLASGVLFGSACGVLVGGWTDDWINRHASDRLAARRNYCTLAFFLAAGFLYASLMVPSILISSILKGLSCLCMVSQQPIWWGCVNAVSGRHLGSLFGLMNGAGVFGAMASQFFFPWFTDWCRMEGFDDPYRPAFLVYLAALVLAGILWRKVDTTRPIQG